MKKNVIVLTFILLITNLLSAQDTINVLFLGNSYTAVNNLPQLCSMLAESAGKTMNTGSVTPGGYLLTQHAVNTQSLNLIRERKWDFVVLQEQSQLPTIDFYRYEFMHKGYNALRDSVLLYNPDAQIVGYMTWGRRYGGQQCENYGLGLYCSADFRDFNHMQDSLTSAYNECRELFGGLTAPVGLAWKNALGQNDEIVLHSGDDSHPTLEGSYLAACVFHATFWNETPVGLKHPDGISEKTAAFLQKVAEETVLIPSSISETPYFNDGFNVSFSKNEIIITSEKTRNASVSVFDILGNEMAKTEMTNANDCKISTYNISKGILILKIKDRDTTSTFTRKIAVK